MLAELAAKEYTLVMETQRIVKYGGVATTAPVFASKAPSRQCRTFAVITFASQWTLLFLIDYRQ
jgi:hypothetical protein